MGFFIKKIMQRLAEKATVIDPSDVMTQLNADDILHILKDLLL